MKLMSKSQVATVIIGCALILMGSLFPPRQSANDLKATRAFLLSPDIYTSWQADGVETMVVEDSSGKAVSSPVSSPHYQSLKAEIDAARLFAEIAALLALTAICLLGLQWREE